MSDTTNEPQGVVVPFRPPTSVFTPEGSVCEGCPTDCGRPCEVGLSSSNDPDFTDLLFVAERIMRRLLDQTDWRKLGVKGMAEFLLDESDAESVARLIEGARIEVFFDGV